MASKAASSDLDEVGNQTGYDEYVDSNERVKQLVSKTSMNSPETHEGKYLQQKYHKQRSHLGVLSAMNSMKETERRDAMSQNSHIGERELLASESG